MQVDSIAILLIQPKLILPAFHKKKKTAYCIPYDSLLAIVLVLLFSLMEYMTEDNSTDQVLVKTFITEQCTMLTGCSKN